MDDIKELEKKSSAITLSDMEIFIFPELLYALVLANIMSPRIWSWRDDPWFKNIAGMKPNQRVARVKQYIMDHYSFNLDLETWGLTTREKELARFKDFVSEETLKNSNALFGYEGDKYYFKIDIRTHFGLDKYEDNIIPYWKTETVEAMDAFKYKKGHAAGAGECVSLAAVYAAALFIVANIPLEDIYMMSTPLHSQNYIDIGDGILTNNRRLVTRSMWYNGTALSAQARRALENERVTVISHISGFIHTLYTEATIEKKSYKHFKERLNHFLNKKLTDEIIINFLRYHQDIQKCFQLKWSLHGVDHYIAAETVFKYEHGSPYRLSNKTRPNLLSQIEIEEYQPSRILNRIVLNDLETFVRQNDICFSDPEQLKLLTAQFATGCLSARAAIKNLAQFCHLTPNLPEPDDKLFVPREHPFGIEPGMTRGEIYSKLEAVRAVSDTADLAFYAYRDLNYTEVKPFLKAALERNPVSIEAAAKLDADSLLKRIEAMPSKSIYDGHGRLAQPDEAWNYGRADGLEKALLVANILHARMPGEQMSIHIKGEKVVLSIGDKDYHFQSKKEIGNQNWKL